MKTLRVNMDRLEAEWESVPPDYERLGGRALIAKILLTEVPPHCEPLGPYNRLIFAPGLLGGTSLSSSGRLCRQAPVALRRPALASAVR